MRFSIFIICLLGFLYLTLAQEEDCCLQYLNRLRHSVKKRVTSYREQKTEVRCIIPAIVFTLDNGQVFCIDPREKWVYDLMQRVDRLSEGSSVRRKVRSSGSSFRRSEQPLNEEQQDINRTILITPKTSRIVIIPRPPRSPVVPRPPRSPQRLRKRLVRLILRRRQPKPPVSSRPSRPVFSRPSRPPVFSRPSRPPVFSRQPRSVRPRRPRSPVRPKPPRPPVRPVRPKPPRPPVHPRPPVPPAPPKPPVPPAPPKPPAPPRPPRPITVRLINPQRP